MKPALIPLCVAVLCCCASAPAQDRKPAPETRKTEKVAFNFDEAVTGQVPKGFTVAETKGAGTPAVWRVEPVQDDPKHKNAVKVDSKNKEAVFNLLLSEASYGPDVDVSVAVKASTGEDDQGGGLLWRAKDADNYYITRWNPLEKNLRVYKVEWVKGEGDKPGEAVRTTLKSAEVDSDPKTWHTIRVIHAGTAIKISFDGKEVLTAEDATFKDAGKVGLWTKADASSWFDDLTVESAKK